MIPKHQTQAFLTGPGSVEIRRRPMPEPGPGELLIRVDAATTCGTDVKVYRRGGHPAMLTLPSPFGHEVTGAVVRAAAGTAHGEGRAVVVANSASCGECPPCRRGRENLCRNLVYLNGAFADYLLIPEAVAKRSVYRRPGGLDPVVAAMAEPLACAVHCLERCLGAWGGSPTEARALVIGCGPLGLMLVDLFDHAGACVSALDPHPRRVAAAERFGAAKTRVGRAGGGNNGNDGNNGNGHGERGYGGNDEGEGQGSSYDGHGGSDEGGNDGAGDGERNYGGKGEGKGSGKGEGSGEGVNRGNEGSRGSGEGDRSNDGGRSRGANDADRAGAEEPLAGASFDFAVDATGTPAGWEHAVASLAPGGVAALFGGCRPGTRLSIDADRVHYREQTLLGVYHHRPSSFRTALDRLTDAPERYRALVERELPLDQLSVALDLMIERRALKVAIRPQANREP